MVPRKGFEPSTLRVWTACSSQLSYLGIWWREPDLNQRPSGYEPDELPDCSIPRQYFLDNSFKWCLGPDLNRHGKKFHRILSPVRLPISPPRHKNLLSLTRIRVYNNWFNLSSVFSSFFNWFIFLTYTFLFSASSNDLYPLCFTIFSRFFSARFLFSNLQFFI